MSKPKYTPGPWIVKETSDGTQLRVDSVLGFDAEYVPADTIGNRYAITDPVALCFNANKPNEISEERRANASLISAAPDLLEAAIRVINSRDWNSVQDNFDLLRQAIAKAEKVNHD